jgi:DNA-binding MarR family transcriptional regulator
MKNSRSKKDSAPDALLLSFLTAANTVRDRLEAALTAAGLSSAKYELLSQLVRAGEPLTLRALAEGQHCVPSNITQLVDRLETDGLVRRVADADDRRRVRAALTPLGAQRAAAGAKALERFQEEFVASLPPAERAALSRLLRTLG